MSTSSTALLSPVALAQVLERIELGLIGFSDRDNRILFCNRKAKELLGVELDGFMFSELFSLRGQLRQTSSRIMVGDTVRVGDRHVGYTVYELPDRTQWVVLRDVTDKLHLQRAAEGVAATNNLGYAFAGVAHELGNPINSIKTALAVLMNSAEGSYTREQVREYLSMMYDETVRAQEILRLMQSFAGHSTLVRAKTELRPLVDSIVALARRDVVPPTIAVNVVGDPRGQVWAAVDASAIRQVVLNLLSNAVDAVGAASSPTITVDVYRGDTFAHIRVSDNGRGLTPEQQQKLFLPFYSTRRSGMGFGLVIVRKLVSSMGGAIEVHSVPGVGTTFDLRFAIDDSDARAETTGGLP